MAAIDDLVAQVQDSGLRSRLERAVRELKSVKRFGLVYEEHLPEAVAMPGVAVKAGGNAFDSKGRLLRVLSVESKEALVSPALKGPPPSDDENVERLPLADLTAASDLEGDSIFPVLEFLGETNGPDAMPAGPRHLAIEAENYHSLLLLEHLYGGQVDCIYIDPPYNNGAADWAYNNSFVDVSDGYRHSKWLAMMGRRLRLATNLLKPDGVLIVTIDDSEVHRLSLLLGDLFPQATQQLITLQVNPKGITSNHFSSVEENALFCFFGEASVCKTPDNLLDHKYYESKSKIPPATPVRWNSLLKSGINSRPQDRPGLTYPIGLDSTGRVVGTGRTLAERRDAGEIEGDTLSLDFFKPDPDERIAGADHLAWPYNSAGQMANWTLKPSTLERYATERRVKSSRQSDDRWSFEYLSDSQMKELRQGDLELADEDDGITSIQLKPVTPMRRPMTMWRRGRHETGPHGSTMQKELLGEKRFEFPKPLYSTLDAIAAVVADRPDALVLDFFAGSGTTLHATALLNLADNGSRRCVLITNNEVSSKRSKEMKKKGLRPGDKEWEAEGVFHKVTRPRVEAALTGLTPSGKPVNEKLKYLTVPFGPQLDPDFEPKVHERKIAEGLPQSAVFAKLGFVDPDRLLWDGGGEMFDDVHLLLWAASGGHGPAPSVMVGDIDLGKHEPGWLLPGSGTPSGAPAINGECRYGVLFRPSRVAGFCKALKDMPQVSHVWVNASDDDEFRHLSKVISIKRPDVKVSNLFRDLYDHFANKRRQIR